MALAERSIGSAAPVANQGSRNSKELIATVSSNEIVFAVVGHVGSGTSEIANKLKELLSEKDLPGGPYDTEILKAREVIVDWAHSDGRDDVPEDKHQLDSAEKYQDLGDAFRSQTQDNAAVAKSLIGRIKATRANKQQVENDGPVAPDGKRRAYILDSIRHPAEVKLLQQIYQDAFVLIGVVCETQIRRKRLQKHYPDAGEARISGFMRRDSKADQAFGQRTSDAFHLADFFVENSENRFVEREEAEPEVVHGNAQAENENWTLPDELSRLVKIISHSEIVRPTIAETGMHHAYSAQLRSACLSRQVGAAIVGKDGTVLATGTNEVPKAGGGVYEETFDSTIHDHRCAYQNDRYCSNTREQGIIADQILKDISDVLDLTEESAAAVKSRLRAGRLKGLLEFSRAVHAEMDALLSAGRAKADVVGARMYVTTFPCHYCARHLISAGVDEVQYIEPYPKSLAFKLHSDAIQLIAKDWIPPSEAAAQIESDPLMKDSDKESILKKSRVLFRPFAGVAPRMYRRAFFKNRDLKNDVTGDLQISEPEWATSWSLKKIGYVDLEDMLLSRPEEE